MRNENITKIRGVIDLFLENESRINEAKPIRYWYPLSLATYGTEEILEALDSMCSFRTSMAEKTQHFEQLFAKWQGCPDAVMVNSGSSADLLLCHLLTNPLKPILPHGSEIIIPVVTWPTQIWSAMMAGLKVKLVDVDHKTLNVDLDDLERSIGPETRAIFLVHLMGNPCDMDRVAAMAKKYDLVILEDTCEALGSKWDGIKVGNCGVGGTFSFFFSHHITCMEGGMIAVQDPDMAEQLRILRAHGWTRNVDTSRYHLDQFPDIDPRYAFINWGLNVRPTEVQASFGIRQMEKIDRFADQRNECSSCFFDYLEKQQWLNVPTVLPKAEPSWLAIPIMISAEAPFQKNEITQYLEAHGVETRPIVTGNIARHPVAKLLPEFKVRNFPGADKIHALGFYIGLSPMQTPENMGKLISVFDQFLSNFLLSPPITASQTEY